MQKKINDLNVKKLASESELKKVTEELEDCKNKIKEIYGVEINDFASAIETMKNEYKTQIDELSELVKEAESKIGDK
ncbi:MAG: hypothetical protein IKP65_03080 [Alphaproteobacteria bacterium]|nr:hypothetical protein [Alphaproteobacteria bacterium]